MVKESPLLWDRRLIWYSVSAKLINAIYWFHHEFICSWIENYLMENSLLDHVVVANKDFRIWKNSSSFIELLNLVYYLISKYLAINSSCGNRISTNRKIWYVELLTVDLTIVKP